MDTHINQNICAYRAFYIEILNHCEKFSSGKSENSMHLWRNRRKNKTMQLKSDKRKVGPMPCIFRQWKYVEFIIVSKVDEQNKNVNFHKVSYKTRSL